MPKLAGCQTTRKRKCAASHEPGADMTKPDKGRNVLAFAVHHGDMVVIHGTQIHRYYDVSEAS